MRKSTGAGILPGYFYGFKKSRRKTRPSRKSHIRLDWEFVIILCTWIYSVSILLFLFKHFHKMLGEVFKINKQNQIVDSNISKTSTSTSRKNDVLHVYFINTDSDTSEDHVITLKNRTSSTAALELHTVPAVTIIEVEEMLKNDSLYFNGGVNLTHGAHSDNDIKTYSYYDVACTLSHLKAILQAYSDGHEMVMVLEDTAVITMDFMENWKLYADVAPSDWQILQWTTSNIAANKRELYTHNDYWVAWRPYFRSTLAYSIRREGMMRILDASYERTQVLRFNSGGSNTSKGDYVHKWTFSEPDIATADSYIYLLARNTYTATYPWVVLQSNVSSITMVDNHVDYSTFGRPDTTHPTILSSQRHNLEALIHRPETVAVVTYLYLKDESDATDEISRLKVDIEEFSKHHSNSRWYINLIFGKKDLKSYVEQSMMASLAFSSASVYIDMHAHEHRFNKFAFVSRILDHLGSFDYILFKDNNIPLAGFEWNSFMGAKANSIVAGPFYESVDEWLWRSRLERTNIERLVDFQYSSLFNTHYEEGYTSLIPIATMFLDMRFILMRSDFAIWFFPQVLTEEFINQDVDWGPDFMLCGAAYEYRAVDKDGRNHFMTPCSLVPFNIMMRRDTKQILENDDVNMKGNQMIDSFRKNPKFSRWMDGSATLQPKLKTFKNVWKKCKRMDSEMNMNQCGILFATKAVGQWINRD